MISPVTRLEVRLLIMWTLVHSCSCSDEAIPIDRHSNSPDLNLIDRRIPSPERSGKENVNRGTAALNQRSTTDDECPLFLDAQTRRQWVEDSSAPAGGLEVDDGKFYENLSPTYRPFPEEEASVAGLLWGLKSHEESLCLNPAEEFAAAAAACTARESSLVSVSSPLPHEKEEEEEDPVTAATERDANSADATPAPAPAPWLCRPVEGLRLKRKRESGEGSDSERDRKKLKTNGMGFVTRSVVPAFNWVGIDGRRTINAYLPSQDQLLRSEALKSLVRAEVQLTASESGSEWWCSYKSRMAAKETSSWRAFKLQQSLSGRNGFWRRRQQPVWRNVYADDLRSTLRRWHSSLELDNLSSCTIALHVYQRRVRTLESSLAVVRGVNVTILLAVSLWVAVKLVDNAAKIPSASAMAATAGVPVKLLTYAELPLLEALRWKLVQY